MQTTLKIDWEIPIMINLSTAWTIEKLASDSIYISYHDLLSASFIDIQLNLPD
jgi:hypothetical protein